MDHSSTLEQSRLQELLRLLPRDRRSVLEVGARDGFVTRVLTEQFETVTALDLQKPAWSMDRVTTAKGDIQQLEFPDNSFDTVICTEVLEHVPDVQVGAREIFRVARYEVVVGVPYRQDTRVGRTTCTHCGCENPPYGHLHEFDEARIAKLFSEAQSLEHHYIATTRERTNVLSAYMHKLAGNPYGDYNQEEPCIQCGQKLQRPEMNPMQRVTAGVAERMFQAQMKFNPPSPLWIYSVIRKK